MNNNPQKILGEAAMSRLQIAAVATCVLLNALDGFDVLAISFAAPGIAAQWGIDRGALGIVLSMELIGMAAGSVFLGGVADRVGRRRTIFLCLALMSLGMLLAGVAGSLLLLSVVRLFTGLGIGGMLAATNAMTAEFSNFKRRNLCVALMAAGYPLGAIVGGTVASMLLAHYNWHSVFFLGAAATVSMFPLVFLLLPESIGFLVRQRPAGALERINATLQRMGHSLIDALPEREAEHRRPQSGFRELFAPGLVRTTTLLTVTYFAHIMTFYYILKWIPKIVVDMGFAPSAAGGVLVWANVGGLSGSIVLSFLTQRFNVRSLVVGALFLASLLVVVFGFREGDLQQLALVAALAGFFTNSAIVGLYAIIAQSFPAEVRAGGTGFVIGIGRGGAALGPILAGFLFAMGQGLPFVSLVMAAGSLLAAVALLLMKYAENE